MATEALHPKVVVGGALHAVKPTPTVTSGLWSPAPWVCHTLSPRALYGINWWVLMDLGLRHGPSACGRGGVYRHHVRIPGRQKVGPSNM
jgi:hypothetical protein